MDEPEAQPSPLQRLIHSKLGIAMVAVATVGAMALVGALTNGGEYFGPGSDLRNQRTIRASPTFEDGSYGSLRWALDKAGTDGEGSVIRLEPGVYWLDAGCRSANTAVLSEAVSADSDRQFGDLNTPKNDEPLTIDGSGATIRQTCPGERVLRHSGTGSLTIRDVVIQGGDANSTYPGGFSDGSGGGVWSDSGADLVIDDAVFRDNSSGSSGGALFASGNESNVIVTGSSFVGNSAASGGGALAVLGSLELINSTVANNIANTHGALTASDLTLSFTTISDNNALAGVDGRQVGANTLSTLASVISGGWGAVRACDVDVVESRGWNFGDDGSCGADSRLGDVQAPNSALLAALGNYRGITFVRPPLSTSSTINVVPAAVCAEHVRSDQIGGARPVGDACDAGAVEFVSGLKPIAGTSAPAARARPASGVANYTG